MSFSVQLLLQRLDTKSRITVEKPPFSWFWLLERLPSACVFRSFLAPDPSAVALSSVLYSGFCVSAPHFLISSLCAPWWAGTQPGLLAAPGLCIALVGATAGWGGRLQGLSWLPRSLGAPARGGSASSSGIVAAAGVVNQADEQRILLPGYFTTPGLHHTHPLQASLVGPRWTWTWGWGGGGQAVCERLFSLAHWISV